MKRPLHLLVLSAYLLLLASCGSGVTRYVNPFVGTDGHGHTFPGAIVPFGQIQPGPDTRLEGWDGCSGYHYTDDTLYGFSHTHLNGTGCEDLCDVLLMPVTAENSYRSGGQPEALEGWHFTKSMPQEEFRSHFSHRSEKATPGYYRVVLDRNRVMVELTATERVAAHRYTFPSQGKKGFVVDLRHRDRVIDAGFDAWKKGSPLTGWRESNAWNPHQKCFFALECNQEIEAVHLFDGGWKALVVLPDKCREVEVFVAISGVDGQGACNNLATHGHDADFDVLHKAATERWEKTLGKIAVEGGSLREKKNFYTALYHCYTQPYLWSDADGRYRGMDDSIYTSETRMYTVFSLWDTYRACHPLMTILEPERTQEWVATMLRQYETGGELTMWELWGNETHCMIGYHACPVILEAMQAGLLDEWPDEKRMALLEAMVATSNRTEAHRAYGEQGYLDSQKDNESVSKTLEYAFDDWCIAQFALIEMSHGPEPVGSEKYNYLNEVADLYMRRAQSWQNIMDADGFMHARRNGGFVTPFNPTEVNNNYTEANCWQYSSYVPHDVEGWIARLGGKEKAEAFLDTLFSTSSKTTGRDQSDITGMIGQYAHGNEPSHHAAYLYAYVGAPEKLDKTVHRILHELYSPTPDGLCGNEDCGQMSAWYVLSAMGFYPVCPGSGEYVTVSPLFDRVTLHRDGKEDIVIDKRNWQPGLFWDGEDYRNSESRNRFDGQRYPAAPVFSDWQQKFEDSCLVEIFVPSTTSTTSPTSIYYTLSGGTPDKNATRYTEPITVRGDAIIKAVAYDTATGLYSPVVSHTMTRFVADKRLSYVTRPDPQYTENGEEGLIDRLHGTENYRIGGWQGWTGDMEVIVDLLETRAVYSVGVECLENMRSWIFFPRQVEISTSLDGQHYTDRWIIPTDRKNKFPDSRERQGESVVHNFEAFNLEAVDARYLRIKAVNYGKMPDWHVSAGEQAWLFVDEVEVHWSSPRVTVPVAAARVAKPAAEEEPDW
ncbi:MAG: GH92 family glycosyl hydrolase [Bacteroidales bacterium]|nr:GH92 family glycosyl hydrolase [Bacteroidales bacterium]